MNLRRAGIGALFALSACLSTPSLSNVGTTSTGSGSGSSPSWVGELHATSAASAAYSLVHDEQGPYFAVVGIAGSNTGTATCSEELATASTQTPLTPLGLWTLEIAAPASPGQYAVLSAQGDPIYPNLGQSGSVVRLVLAQSATSAMQIYPVSGSVSITSGPATVSQELGGQHLMGSYHLGFAAEPLQGNCSFATAIYDLGNQVVATDYVCSCITPEGKQVFSCDGGGGNFDGCCYQDAPAAFTVDGTFDATACPGLCVAPFGIKACHPLLPDGG